MNEAIHADKSVVKYFGSHFEEFRREMFYNKEIVLSDILTQQWFTYFLLVQYLIIFNPFSFILAKYIHFLSLILYLLN